MPKPLNKQIPLQRPTPPNTPNHGWFSIVHKLSLEVRPEEGSPGMLMSHVKANLFAGATFPAGLVSES
jgi:hypothetical protein